MIHNKYVILGKILGTDVIIICFFNPLCIFTCILTVVLSYMVSLSCTYMHTASQYHSTLLSCNIYEYWSNFTLVHYWFFTGFLNLPLNLFISRFFAKFHWFLILDSDLWDRFSAYFHPPSAYNCMCIRDLRNVYSCVVFDSEIFTWGGFLSRNAILYDYKWSD